jgi:hypothetical protein
MTMGCGRARAGACRLAAVLLLAGAGGAAQATDAPEPAFRPHRFDEDWRGVEAGFLDPIKDIPVAAGASLSIGGQVRERYEFVRNRDFGLDPPADDDYVLHRLLLHGDLRAGDRVRAFVELGSFLSAGRRADPPPTDEAPLSLQQAFLDVTLPLAGIGSVTARGGRQEVSYGSSRLVSVRESPNIRRTFDGGRSLWRFGAGRVDAFFLRPVEPDRQFVANRYDDDIRFWGLYGTVAVPPLPGLAADLYYLGYHRPDAGFAQGTADERRHTLGTRLFGDRDGWDWDLELAYQVGRFGQGDISAWTAAFDGGYTVAAWPLSPRFGLKANIASGDDDLDDETLGTFNALFPRIPYFTEASLVAPANIMDVFPMVTVTPVPGLAVSAGWNALWRQRAADAFYSPPLDAVDGTEGGSRWVGHQSTLEVAWQATRHLAVNLAYVHFEAGATIRRAGGRNVDYVALWTSFRF